MVNVKPHSSEDKFVQDFQTCVSVVYFVAGNGALSTEAAHNRMGREGH